jgi:hypothetical protein
MRAAARSIAATLGVMALGLVLVGAPDAAPPKSKSKAAKRPPGDTTAVLATVGGEPITRAMVDARIAELPEQYRTTYATPEGRRQLLDRFVEERVWVKEAEAAGVAERPDVKSTLDRQRRDLIVRTHITEQMATFPAVSDSEARAFYDGHIDQYRTPATVTLAHIQLASQSQATKVRKLADKGDDWGGLVRKYSTDSLTIPTQGSLGTVTREGLFSSIGTQPALAESAMALGADKTGGPYRTDRGWHVIRVSATQPDATRPFEQMKSTIVRQVSSERSQAHYQELLAKARTQQKVVMENAAVDRWVSVKRSAREMFQDAQALGPPRDRIQAYGRLVETYPDSAVSAQAQFMTGFILSEELESYGEAQAAFEKLLMMYPNSELTESARWMLENMRTKEAPAFTDAAGDTLVPAPVRAAQKGKHSP